MLVRVLGWVVRSCRSVTSSKKKLRRTVSARLVIVEAIEQRSLLSSAPLGYATPELIATHFAPNGITSLATAGPTGMSPQLIRHAYGFDQITFSNGAVGNGAGETIAIVDAYDDPNIANDLHQFDVAFGLADPVFTKVNLGGAANSGWATEIALDVEWAHAVAQGANILLVEAKSNSMSDLMSAVDYARSYTGVVAVSMSWGGGEFSSESSYDSHFVTPSGHTGVAFFASSGDTGAPASYPSASPNVVSVGGTTLNLSSGSYSSEAAWSGSGGGLSAYEKQPAYQAGIVTQSSTMRGTPDVSYDSNPSTGFAVYDSYNNGTATPWGQWGGTSDAAPQWAALVAIADQGRAIAGLGSLDGATQLLPALYQLPSSDFHDITSGSSTGSPSLSAGAGYDLVTGRGSPIANLVVRDLGASTVTTSTVTHFAISGPTSATAGSAFSVTVTALDASNHVVTNYTGTVQFSTTDTGSGVVLPANYTFSATDSGVHTFTGLKLVTAATESITARDTKTTSVLATLSLKVNPATATHLVFSTQPSGGAPAGTITPAVTVSLYDAYNNLASNDSTDSVSLSLSSTTAGAVLSGTTSATVVAGVATFSNLSINLAGTYALIATSGSMPSVTSASFTVQAVVIGPTSTIESFETGSLSAYKVADGSTMSASETKTAAHDGTYGLADTNGNDWIYRTDSAAQVKAGDTLSVWVKFAGTSNGRAYFGFGASSTGTLALVAAPNTNQLILQLDSFANGGTFMNLATVSQSWQANVWYRLEVDWSTSGQVVGRLFAANGSTLLNSVLASQPTSSTAITSGGIAFRGFGSATIDWDTVQRTPGVNTFAATATGSVLTAATSLPPSLAEASFATYTPSTAGTTVSTSVVTTPAVLPVGTIVGTATLVTASSGTSTSTIALMPTSGSLVSSSLLSSKTTSSLLTLEAIDQLLSKTHYWF